MKRVRRHEIYFTGLSARYDGGMALSFGKPVGLEQDSRGDAVNVLRQRELARLLAFAGWTIDDVVNNPLAKRDVYNWYRMSLRMKRRLEVIDLERQWNPLH